MSSLFPSISSFSSFQLILRHLQCLVLTMQQWDELTRLPLQSTWSSISHFPHHCDQILTRWHLAHGGEDIAEGAAQTVAAEAWDCLFTTLWTRKQRGEFGSHVGLWTSTDFLEICFLHLSPTSQWFHTPPPNRTTSKGPVIKHTRPWGMLHIQIITTGKAQAKQASRIWCVGQ